MQSKIEEEQPSVLLVDDDADALHLLSTLMEKNGYRVYTAKNADDALELLEEKYDKIEVIILDIMMPGAIDGYGVIKRAKADPHTRRIPIIVLSAKSSSYDMAQSYALGAFQHVTKPYDIHHLEAVIDSMVKLRRLERDSNENMRKYQAIVENSPIMIVLLSDRLTLLELNAAFRKTYPDAEIGKDYFSVVYDTPPEHPENHPISLALATGHKQDGLISNSREDKRRHVQVHATPLRDEESGSTTIVVVAIDMTEQVELEERLRAQIDRNTRAIMHQDQMSDHLMKMQKELKQKNEELEETKKELERLSITDPLTSLYNRRQFDAVLEQEARRSKRYRHPLAVQMLDIDHFKLVNDTHGHPIGDEILKEIAKILHNHLRETDTIARYGGEEFVTILPETDMKTAETIADRLRSTIAEHSFETDAGALNITVSIGVTSVCSRNIVPEKVLQKADEALYRAKDNGRNNVVTSSPDTEHLDSM